MAKIVARQEDEDIVSFYLNDATATLFVQVVEEEFVQPAKPHVPDTKFVRSVTKLECLYEHEKKVKAVLEAARDGLLSATLATSASKLEKALCTTPTPTGK